MTTETDRQIEQLTAAFEAHGYFVSIEPIPGEEADYVNHLREGFAKIEAVLKFNARRYGFRGLSKRALTSLHRDCPAPAWGIEIAR